MKSRSQKKTTEQNTGHRRPKSKLRKPRLGHGPKNPHPNSRKNLKPPWQSGQTGNPKNRNLKGPRIYKEIQKLFYTLAGEADPEAKGIRMEEWFFRNHRIAMKGKNRDALQAMRLLMEYSLGSPAQTVKIMPAVDIYIGLAPDIEQPNLLDADNVMICRPEPAESDKSHTIAGEG